MELHKVPDGTWVRVIGEAKAPPAARVCEDGEEVFYSHIDGMYSYCKDRGGKVVHLLAWQEVEIVKEQDNET